MLLHYCVFVLYLDNIIKCFTPTLLSNSKRINALYMGVLIRQGDFKVFLNTLYCHLLDTGSTPMSPDIGK